MFGIDKDSLLLIQDTAKKSAEVKLVPLPNNPEKSVLLGNGTHQIIDTPFVAPNRRHTVESLASFADAYARWAKDSGDVLGTDGDDETTIRLPNVWVDLPSWRLQFYTDEPLRQSWVRLALARSPQWDTVAQFRSPVSLDQKAIVRLLRHDLHGCVEPGAVAAFRSIDFQKVQNAKASLQHGKQSLDADIVAQVTSGPLPEQLFVRFPVFAMAEIREFTAGVTLTIDVDADSKRFTLQALPGELDIALDEARSLLIDRIDSELTTREFAGTHILAGAPKKARDDE